MWFLFVLFFHIASMTLERMTFTTASPAMTTGTTSTRTSSRWKLDSPWWVRCRMVHACVWEREDGKGCHYPTAVRELTCHAYVCCFASSMLQIRYMQVSVALYRTLLSKAPSSAPLSFPVNVCRLKPLRPVCLYCIKNARTQGKHVFRPISRPALDCHSQGCAQFSPLTSLFIEDFNIENGVL